MLSSTEPLSMGSVHGYSDGLWSPKVRSPRSRSQRLSSFTQQDIENLLESVPQVGELFTVLDKIGEGTFSQVYLARLKSYPTSSRLYALKHIIPTSHPSRTENELRCLQDIGGCDNIMEVQLCLREKDHVVIVMPYFSHEKLQDFISDLTIEEIRDYMKNLLIALRRIHKQDIIHRDVKPSNFLYDRKNKRYSLVDFGLAQKAPVPLQRENTSNPTLPVGAKRKTRQMSIENDPTLSPSKRQRTNTAGDCHKLSEIHFNQNEKLDSNKSPAVVDPKELPKRAIFTPPTPNLDNLDFAKTYKSPRRALLAKRALLVESSTALFAKSSIVRARNKHLHTLNSTCSCYGNPQVCSLCVARSPQCAPRAGTPGFRSPEVLMKWPQQTTAVDIWSAGVIFLSLLSGRTPFFRAKDDMTALAQIIAIQGSAEVKKSALSYDKHLVARPHVPAPKLETVCKKLKQVSSTPSPKSKKKSPTRRQGSGKKTWTVAPSSAYDLLEKLLDLNPHTRITAVEALNHPFFVTS